MKLKVLILILIISLSSIVGFTLSRTIPQHDGQQERLAREVMSDLSKFRGLTPPEEFHVNVVSLDWVKEHWGKSSSMEEPLEWKIYKALLFIPANASFEEFEEEWVGHTMAASSGDVLYMVAEMIENADNKTLRRILAHESTHILQYFNFEIARSGIHDEEQAMNALIEGDADLSADLYLKAEGLSPPERWTYKPEGLGFKEALLLIKFFPYQYGEPFIEHIYREGGWKLVNEAYENPPSSTEQIMHPEKYLLAEGFEEPKLIMPNREWNCSGEDRLGEYFIYTLLARWNGYNIAEIASSGWNGDRVACYQNDSNFLLIWSTLWDSEADAEEFYQAMVYMLSNAGGFEILEKIWKIDDIFIVLKISNICVEVYSSDNIEALSHVLNS